MISAIELVIVLITGGILAFVGYMVYDRPQDDKATGSDITNQSATANDVPSAPEIKSTNDLDKASAMLNDINPNDNSDSS